MVSVDAALLINILHLDATFDDATMENLIDQAIDMLNLYGRFVEIPNMTGAAGSKTVDLDSPQKGAVVMVVRTVYNAFYEDSDGSMSVGGVAIAAPNIMGNPTVMKAIKESARLLFQRENSMEVDVG